MPFAGLQRKTSRAKPAFLAQLTGESGPGSKNPRPNDAAILGKKMPSGTAVIPNHEIRCFSNSSASARSPAFLAALIVEKNSGDWAYGNAFSDELWKEILYVTSQLTAWEPIAKTSASFKETLKTLHKLAELARSLRHDIAPQRTHLGDFTPEEIWYGFFCVHTTTQG
jgi:hypothetical protein